MLTCAIHADVRGTCATPRNIPRVHAHTHTRTGRPLRGGKYSYFEGGIKVVGMVRYPALLNHRNGRAGTAWPGLVHTSDWYTTLCTLAGVDSDDTGPGKVAVDGVDVLPAIVAGTASPRTELSVGLRNGTEGSYRCNTPGLLPHWPAGTATAGAMKLIVGKQKPSAWVGRVNPAHAHTLTHRYHTQQHPPARRWNPPLMLTRVSTKNNFRSLSRSLRAFVAADATLPLALPCASGGIWGLQAAVSERINADDNLAAAG